jgi:hypothetical protein
MQTFIINLETRKHVNKEREKFALRDMSLKNSHNNVLASWAWMMTIVFVAPSLAKRWVAVPLNITQGHQKTYFIC